MAAVRPAPGRKRGEPGGLHPRPGRAEAVKASLSRIERLNEVTRKHGRRTSPASPCTSPSTSNPTTGSPTALITRFASGLAKIGSHVARHPECRATSVSSACVPDVVGQVEASRQVRCRVLTECHGGLRPDHRFAGRAAGQEFLGDALQDAVAGIPHAIVIHGEAGIGKTRLTREVCGYSKLNVLWGSWRALRWASVPFAPVTRALQDWLSRADADEKAETLAGTDGLSALLPSLGISAGIDATRLPMLVDLVFNRIAVRRPTVVVVDDLQWADVASLDVMAYLMAGFRSQPLGFPSPAGRRNEARGIPSTPGWPTYAGCPCSARST